MGEDVEVAYGRDGARAAAEVLRQACTGILRSGRRAHQGRHESGGKNASEHGITSPSHAAS
jgi:hypothetical protein